MKQLKRTIRNKLLQMGYDVRRTSAFAPARPGNPERPIGDMEFFMEDLRARGFSPDSILDVGGNHGDWSRLAKKYFLPPIAF